VVSPAKAFPGARAIVGIAIRVQSGGSKYECIYLPPTNGRAGDMTGATIRRDTSASPIGRGNACARNRPAPMKRRSQV